MNILLIGHEQQMNGASKCLIDIASYLKSKQHTVYILTSFNEGPFYENAIQHADKVFVYKYHRWIIERPKKFHKWLFVRLKYGYLLLKDLIMLQSLYPVFSSLHLDIIHSNTSVISIGAFISKRLDIPHIWHLREFGEEDFNMLPVLGKRVTWHFMSKRAFTFIAISNAIQEKYKAYLGEAKIVRIYDGVKEVNLPYKNANEHISNLLIAGRISDAKGQKEAVEMFSLLKQQTSEEIHLFIAGSGDQTYIKSMPEYENLKHEIHLLGLVDDMISLRAYMDFELVCSKSEGFGLVTVEAMMAGHPVVGASAGATKEIIIEGYNGYLYEKGDLESFTKKVSLLLDKQRCQMMGKNACDYAKQTFTIKANVESILEIYISAIEAKETSYEVIVP